MLSREEPLIIRHLTNLKFIYDLMSWLAYLSYYILLNPLILIDNMKLFMQTFKMWGFARVVVRMRRSGIFSQSVH